MLTRVVGEYEIDFEWHGFELHPRTPRGGMELAKLFPNMDLATMKARMKTFAAGFGVTMEHPSRLPNTRRPLAIAEYARDQGRLDPFRNAAMEAHWNRGLDIEADDVLRGLAAEAGLDPVAALAAADDPAFQARVAKMGAEAAQWGVTGIPTYVVLPDGFVPGGPRPAATALQASRIVGCQPREVVEAAFLRAGVARRGA